MPSEIVFNKAMAVLEYLSCDSYVFRVRNIFVCFVILFYLPEQKLHSHLCFCVVIINNLSRNTTLCLSLYMRLAQLLLHCCRGFLSIDKVTFSLFGVAFFFSSWQNKIGANTKTG